MAFGWFWDDLWGWFGMVLRWFWMVLRVFGMGLGCFGMAFGWCWAVFWAVVVHACEMCLACFLIVFVVPGAQWLRRLRSKSPWGLERGPLGELFGL